MTIHFLKADAVAALKANVKNNIKYYDSPDNEWIYTYFDGENPFADYKFQIEDFQLVMPETPGVETGKYDVENAIRLYSAMKVISDTQATDERLWAGLCHGDFWDYVHCRWKTVKMGQNPASTITSRYFLNNKDEGTRLSLFANTVSRLWWLGRLTYDETRQDPFELTRYWETEFTTKLWMFHSNYMGNPILVRGLISALIALENDGFAIKGRKSNIYRQASQYLNVLGGTHIVDYFTEQEIKEKILYHMWGLIGRRPPVHSIKSN